VPKLGCLGITLGAIALIVVGGLFVGVPKPGVHLPPGNILTAEHPHHWTDTDSDWIDAYGIVGVEVEAENEDKELVAGEEIPMLAKIEEAENLPEVDDDGNELHYKFDWTFLIDEEIVAEYPGEHAHFVFPGFAEKGDLSAQVVIWETSADTDRLVAGGALNEHENSAFPLNNTMISAWLTVIVLIAVVGIGMRKRALIPTGLQNAIEAAVEWLLTFVENAAGRENGRTFFPIVATIFFFVITNAYLALFPIFNVIGWGHTMTYSTPFFGEQEGFVVTTQLFRSANTDVNLPLALAVMSFLAVEFWGIRAVGLGSYVGKFIQIKPVFKSIASGKPMNMVIAFIGAFVGLIELLTEFIRLVSFTFRLFGNMTAGEVLLLMMSFLLPFLAAVPFYGLELIVGFIQALVFAGLTLGFAMIAVMPHEHEEEGH